MKRLNVLIADDEQVARSRLARLLSAFTDVEVVGEAKDGEEVLARIAQGGVDVVLLDVQMPRLTGAEALAQWPKDGPRIVFCTAHPEAAVAAFDGGADDYLLKPVDSARLRKALDRARERLPVEAASLNRLPISTRGGVVLVDPRRITHAVLEGELVTVHTEKETYVTDFTLADLEARLPRGPLSRVHRKALLNLDAVTRLEPLETGGYLARVASGLAVEVSRQSARDLRRRLGL